jgi:putative sigma-54 modulation protein
VQVKVSARHGHLGEDAQTQLKEKAEKLLHFFERLTFIEVTVDFLKGDGKRVEILAKCEHAHDFVAHVDAPDVMTAMNATMDKVKHQITHYKERLQDHRGNPSANGGHKP